MSNTCSVDTNTDKCLLCGLINWLLFVEIFSLLLTGMDPFVGNHMAQVLRVKPAWITTQALLRRVHQHVGFQVVPVPKRLGAVFTLENFLRCVYFQVGDVVLLQSALERAECTVVHRLFQVFWPVRYQLRYLINARVTWKWSTALCDDSLSFRVDTYSNRIWKGDLGSVSSCDSGNRRDTGRRSCKSHTCTWHPWSDSKRGAARVRDYRLWWQNRSGIWYPPCLQRPYLQVGIYLLN